LSGHDDGLLSGCVPHSLVGGKVIPSVQASVQRAVLVGLLCLWAVPAFAQGCAMCYSSASAASKDGQRAISRAVAVLVAPPLGVMTLGVGLAFRYGRKRDQEQNLDDDPLPL
jgi:hypothetical protein